MLFCFRIVLSILYIVVFLILFDTLNFNMYAYSFIFVEKADKLD